MNYNQRHNYYVSRTMKWLESHGFKTKKVETNFTIHAGGKDIYVKKDFWGADCAFRSTSALGFIQVKTGPHQVAKGAAQLTEDTAWPPDIWRFVAWWEPRQRMSNGPEIAWIRHNEQNHGAYPLPKEPRRVYVAHQKEPGCFRCSREEVYEA